ncbi:hypothetical protein Zm00014a_037683 [Zea mays]|uniref:MADS box interactor-like n=1 Tax=Zea mays TaxID=4577 RepID=A0A3L6E115_MAIZE|nr:hypothetical protein Zm00014a_037683 [Zea mays]PWZ14485.1 hypothetical protein Zm00014a_037683 [Zea mays]
MEPSPTSSSPAVARRLSPEVRRVPKRALEELLEQVQRAVEMLRDADADLAISLSEETAAASPEAEDRKDDVGVDGDGMATSSVASDSDYETTQMCDLLKSKVGSLEFLQKLNGIQKSVDQNCAVEPDTSWDIIKSDLWEDGDPDDGYVLVKQEDVVDGITSFMAACLLSLKRTKDLPPDQLQKALRKMFSAEKKKSKIRKAWDGTKLIYNVTSWGATAVGFYNNRALLTVASTTFRTSCRVISKFL